MHGYTDANEDDGFVLGPLDLTLHPGELVFLVGGNGSGKTTLAKLLTGLYQPQTGEIRIDGKPVDLQSADVYRELFSALFADGYFFDSLLGLETANLHAQAQSYLIKLELQEKVRVDGGVFSTTELSRGQRKRLALLTAYLEDRPVYVLDEWAADQDPRFRKVFYTELLPELKARGKCVLVITHDESYFDMADRVIRLSSGKLDQGSMSDVSRLHHGSLACVP